MRKDLGRWREFRKEGGRVKETRNKVKQKENQEEFGKHENRRKFRQKEEKKI